MTRLRGYTVETMVQNPIFDLTIFIFILLNSFIIGLELDLAISGNVEDSRGTFRLFERLFVLVFLTEVCLRFYAAGYRAYFTTDPWNYLDMLTVISAMFELVLDIVTQDQGSGETVSGLSVVRLLRVIKMVRLFKVLRIVRIIRYVMALRVLVYSIMVTMKMLVWAFILYFLLIYIFAIMLVQLLPEDFKSDPLLAMYYGSLPECCLTLFKATCGGLSWHDATFPLRMVSLGSEMVFVVFIGVSYFCVLNVVTGVFCSSANAAADTDPELIALTMEVSMQKSEKMTKELFSLLDSDDSARVTFAEMEKGLENQKVRAILKALNIESEDAWTLFKYMDVDGNHLISFDEFSRNCTSLRGNSQKVQLAKLSLEIRWLMRGVTEIIDRLYTPATPVYACDRASIS